MLCKRSSFYCVCFIVVILSLKTIGYTLNVVPVVKEVALKKGEVTEITYEIINDHDESLILEISAKTWKDYLWNKSVSLDDWLMIKNTNPLVVTGHSHGQIKVGVKVPENASGELVAMLDIVDADAQEQQIRIRYGVALYLGIENTQIRRLEFKEANFDLVSKSKNSYDLRSRIALKNNGNVHLRPNIKAKIQLPKQAIILEFKYGWPVFPKEQALYQGGVRLSEPLPQGIYPVEFEIAAMGLEKPLVVKGKLKNTSEGLKFILN